jgi:chemotaxis signal transduction protein
METVRVADRSRRTRVVGCEGHVSTTDRRTPQVEPATVLLVVGRIGPQRYAWPADSVERVLPMAAVTHVADLPPSVAGLLDLHGETLAVVDPRPRLGLPLRDPSPAQHLLLLVASGRYLLWVDSIDTLVSVDAAALEEMYTDADAPARSPFITRIAGELVSVLSTTAFDPGPVIQRTDRRDEHP